MDDFPADTDILSQTGAQALNWFQSVAAGSQKARQDFDWLGLAKGAALRARIHDREESLAWAELAVAAFLKLDTEQPGREHDHSGMYCRSAMIEKHGEQSGHGLRDANELYDWFRSRLPVDYDATLTLIRRLSEEMSAEFETEVVAPLREIRNRLTVIKSLPEDCLIPPDVEQFVKLYHQLP